MGNHETEPWYSQWIRLAPGALREMLVFASKAAGRNVA